MLILFVHEIADDGRRAQVLESVYDTYSKCVSRNPLCERRTRMQTDLCHISSSLVFTAQGLTRLSEHSSGVWKGWCYRKTELETRVSRFAEHVQNLVRHSRTVTIELKAGQMVSFDETRLGETYATSSQNIYPVSQHNESLGHERRGFEHVFFSKGSIVLPRVLCFSCLPHRQCLNFSWRLTQRVHYICRGPS